MVFGFRIAHAVRTAGGSGGAGSRRERFALTGKGRAMKRALAVCSIAWGIALISAAHAGGIYVTPDGAGARTGADWDNALGSLQAAVDASAADGTIYLAAGNYTNGPSGAPDLCAITNKTSITIRGGYAGTGTPGARGAGESVVQNPTVRIGRLLRARNTALLFDGVVFEGGYLSGKNSAGAGLHLTTCDATFTNCTFRGNHINSAQYSYGAGFWASGCTLQATDCLFTNNYNYGLDTGHYGGAGYVTQGVVTRFTNCRFDHNWTFARYVAGGGGALYLSGGICEISRCHFLTNVLNQKQGYDRQHARGGAICASGLTRIDIAECHFTGNCALNSYYNNGIGGGGIISFEGATQKATITRCAFLGNEWTGFNPRGADYNPAHLRGDIQLASGVLAMTNVLIASSASTTNALTISGGNAEAINVTITDYDGHGAQVSDGALTLMNTILWGNAAGSVANSGGSVVATYTCAQNQLDGEGNISADPLFVDAPGGNYRLGRGSPCGNVGNRRAFPGGGIDLDGNSRISAGIDLGCYESRGGALMLLLR